MFSLCLERRKINPLLCDKHDEMSDDTCCGQTGPSRQHALSYLHYIYVLSYVFCHVRMYLLGIVYHNGPAADSGVDVG